MVSQTQERYANSNNGDVPTSIGVPSSPAATPVPVVSGAEEESGDTKSSSSGGASPKAPPPPPRVTAPPEFKNVSVGLLHCLPPSSGDGRNKMVGLPPNSRIPLPFETEQFRGEVLLLLRPTPPEIDEIYHDRIFGKKRRNVEIQVQGKFKSKPRGELYMGLEITERMELGLVTKGMCNMLLNFINRFVKVHYSFGDKDDVELPHIVFPFEKADRLIITPPGDLPPPLGYEIVESSESVSLRKSGKVPTPDWNIDDIYTVTYNSMYVDLCRWEVCSLPIMKNVNLKTFWGDSALRMVGYEIPPPPPSSKNNSGGDGRHKIEDLSYLFCAQIKCVEEGTRVSADEASEGSSVGREEMLLAMTGDDSGTRANSMLIWDKARPSMSRSISTSNLLRRRGSDSFEGGRSQDGAENTSDDSDDDGYLSNVDEDDSTVYFDALDQKPSMEFFPEVQWKADEEDDSASGARPQSRVSRLMASRSARSPDTLCPAWVDMCDLTLKHTRVFAFALDGGTTVFRSSSQFYRQFPFSPSASSKVLGSPRQSQTEGTRRRMGSDLARMLKVVPAERVEKFLKQLMEDSPNPADKTFLRRPSRISVPMDSTSRDTLLTARMEGFVARALSERHWIEQWATVTDRHISFYHPDKKKPSFRIRVDCILTVRAVAEEEAPNIPSYHFFAVETLGRTTYLMHATKERRDEWLDFLSTLIGGRHSDDQTDVCQMDCVSVAASDNPTEEFLHKSSQWSCKNRRILNCRHFAFGAPTRGEQIGLQVVERALSKALKLGKDPSDDDLRSFLDSASDLKNVQVSGLSEEARIVIFLNVYHVMVMHAYIILGVPTNGFQWMSYFNMISYQFGDDIFSLAELEHCIIRKGMNPPSQFLSRFALPKSEYAFALGTVSDFRLNFALNCGSLSNPPCVPIYTVLDVASQLDRSTRMYLRQAASLKASTATSIRKGATLTLPRICQWYAADFGQGQGIEDTVRALEPYLDDEVKSDLAKYTGSGMSSKPWNVSGLTVKFSKYDFHCRYLKQCK